MALLDDRATDIPLSDAGQDEFQRAAFAERLAQTLLAPTHTASIVVGLYGKWGEGKSTVLNFIKQHLLALPDQALVVSFNPWLFPDETQLLHNFFAQLAQEIEGPAPEEEAPPTEPNLIERVENWFTKKIKQTDKPLHTRQETLTKLVTDYAGGISYAGLSLSKVISALLPAPPNLEQLRQRIEEKITASGKQIVVMVDDMDRLEKAQIQAMFRLVKLTANFRHTSYLLAFDDVMVARAIGELFAAGADATSADALSAGQNFLEKIVQVPLRLPRARQQDLWDYCRARTQEALGDTQTELDSEQAHRTGQAVHTQRFDDLLRRGVLPRLTTPRLAIRYANAIRFSLPLLRGEVNTVDLLLVEALHIFYPELHQYIAARQADFVGTAETSLRFRPGGASAEPDSAALLYTLPEKFNYAGESAMGARALLTALFPRLTAGSASWTGEQTRATEAELNRLQAVAAPAYFSRYFSYSIARGDVSDQEFSAFVQSPALEQLTYFRDFSQRLSVALTLQRLEYRLPDLSADQSRRLFDTLTQASASYQPDRNWDEYRVSEGRQAVRLLVQLLGQLPADERQPLVTQLLREGADFKLVYEFDQQLQLRHEAEISPGAYGEPSRLPALLSPEEWTQVLGGTPRLLLERALREAGAEPLYRTHPARAFKLLTFIWPGLGGSAAPADYLFRFLDQQPAHLIPFLEVSGQRTSTHGSPYYWGGLSLAHFERLRDVFGQRLYDLVRAQFGDQLVTGVDFEEFEQPTPRQRLQQFIWLYEKYPSTSPAQN